MTGIGYKGRCLLRVMPKTAEIVKLSVKCQKLTDIFFVKALYDMRESVILGMDQRRKPQEKEGTKQMKFDMHCHTKRRIYGWKGSY